MYFQRSAELMENIQAGVASNDLERSKAAAHSLISSSGNLGGQMVSYLSKLMEHFAFERESAPLAEIVEKLKRSQADFIEYLKNDLEKR
jgi:HPt (histidine-containing phosphotransfer) domain-containing protein